MNIIQALLLGLLGGLGIWDSRVGGMWMIDRPLILGPLTGLILGDIETGIVVGGSIELIMMGVVGVGAATIPDTVSAGILTTAFAITSGLEVSAALALALPIATLGQLVGILDRTINSVFVRMADKAAEEGNYNGVDRSLWLGAGVFFISYFLLVFSGALLGSKVIGSFVDMIPQSIINGFSVASGMLPALGIAILMQLLFDKKNVGFFFIGWALTALMGVNTVGTAVLGTAVAYCLYQYGKNRSTQTNTVSVDLSDDLGGEL